MACTLNLIRRLLIIIVTVLTCSIHCSNPPTAATPDIVDTCGHIGSNNETEGTPIRDDHDFESTFYLDMDNPAHCTGKVTSWRICYYAPGEADTEDSTRSRSTGRTGGTESDGRSSSSSRSTRSRSSGSRTRRRRSGSRDDTPQDSSSFTSSEYQATYAVYRPGDSMGSSRSNVVEYTMVAFSKFTANVTKLWNGTSDPTFICYNSDNISPVTIEEGDIIGACVFNNPTRHMARQLDIIGEVSGQSLLHKDARRDCDNNKVPSSFTVRFGDGTKVSSRRLHLYANIEISPSAINSTTLKSTAPLTDMTSTGTSLTTSLTMPAPAKTTSVTVALTSSVTISSTQTFAILSSQEPIIILPSLLPTSILTQHGSVVVTTSLTVEPSSMITSIPTEPLPLSLSQCGTTSDDVQCLSSFVENLEGIVEPQVSKAVVSRVNDLLKSSQTVSYLGSTLLRVLDMFAVNNHNASVENNITQDNVVLLVKEVIVNDTNERIALIEDEAAGISIPREVLTGIVVGRERVRVASLLFRNMSGLLPERLEEDDNGVSDENTIFRLASPVISASLQCDSCTKNNLSDPVEVTFTHQPYDTALLHNDNNGSVKCVFWKFQQIQGRNGSISKGNWSQEGCETKFTSTSTVCKCNHLTNFAILLSARPLELSKAQTLSLQITGYIGVSVSLVAMAATILVFVFFKSLRTMRNYIHIQLCVSLGIAQIIFVAGIQPQLGEGQLVPVGCRLVAVLLHYWFLVSFMWMLMEGVVLYVALVRVFIKYHARYIAAFTITSYGLPLLYVGALTAPLGFVRTEIYRENVTLDYGYEIACYLNPTTHFIWSIIAPVILIFIANVGFFVMAIVIMYRHQKRQHTEKKSHKVKHWIKATISLTVVMGITWIIGILVIEVKALFALAYIFTIFVAFQGLFIFVIFVLLSKQVRENYVKWWKAKVSESDFLSKHFGDKSLLTSLGVPKHAPMSHTRSTSNGASSSKAGSDIDVIKNPYTSVSLSSDTSTLKKDICSENMEEDELKDSALSLFHGSKYKCDQKTEL